MTKPFSLEELIARIRAILRRAGGPGETGGWGRRPGAGPGRPTGPAAAGPVPLSPTEFKLLHYLMVNAGRVVSKAQILDHVWSYDFGGDLSIVESYISYLRRKLDTHRARPLIHTVRGIGTCCAGRRTGAVPRSAAGWTAGCGARGGRGCVAARPGLLGGRRVPRSRCGHRLLALTWCLCAGPAGQRPLGARRPQAHSSPAPDAPSMAVRRPAGPLRRRRPGTDPSSARLPSYSCSTWKTDGSVAAVLRNRRGRPRPRLAELTAVAPAGPPSPSPATARPWRALAGARRARRRHPPL